jgi:hypothetical protein
LSPMTWSGRTRGRPGPSRGTRIAFITAVNCVQSLVFPLVTVKASGRPTASQARWILLVRPPLDRPSPGVRSPPFFRAPAGCWRARTIVESTDTSHSKVPGRVGLCLGGPEYPLKGAVLGPPAEAGVQRGPGAVPLGHVPPGRSGPELPHDPVEHLPVVQPPAAPLRPGQQRLHESPLGIAQFMTTYHPTMIPDRRSFEDIP